ncbi:hypothetical protein ABT340_39760 [Streptosporangium sp. NPDC000239]|uniref:hypothetical protein n=1 Tax=Streptosporangium sp. NPDC000239 TaxID=3154248 RepID=UPI003324EA30
MSPSDLAVLDQLLAHGHSITLSMDGDSADVDPNTGAMTNPGWGPCVRVVVRDHTDCVVTDTYASTVANALAVLSEGISPTPLKTEQLAQPKDRMGAGRLIDSTGRITELRTDSQVATPSSDDPGYRQAWGWIVKGDPKIGRGQQVRVELPDGTVLQGRGTVEVERRLGRRHLKVYVYD